MQFYEVLVQQVDLSPIGHLYPWLREEPIEADYEAAAGRRDEHIAAGDHSYVVGLPVVESNPDAEPPLLQQPPHPRIPPQPPRH